MQGACLAPFSFVMLENDYNDDGDDDDDDIDDDDDDDDDDVSITKLVEAFLLDFLIFSVKELWKTFESAIFSSNCDEAHAICCSVVRVKYFTLLTQHAMSRMPKKSNTFYRLLRITHNLKALDMHKNSESK